jgi:hypothetical protein
MDATKAMSLGVPMYFSHPEAFTKEEYRDL